MIFLSFAFLYLFNSFISEKGDDPLCLENFLLKKPNTFANWRQETHISLQKIRPFKAKIYYFWVYNHNKITMLIVISEKGPLVRWLCPQAIYGVFCISNWFLYIQVLPLWRHFIHSENLFEDLHPKREYRNYLGYQ